MDDGSDGRRRQEAGVVVAAGDWSEDSEDEGDDGDCCCWRSCTISSRLRLLLTLDLLPMDTGCILIDGGTSRDMRLSPASAGPADRGSTLVTADGAGRRRGHVVDVR